ncbi:hypothetical protein GCM10010207_83320 [Streptomyces atratus]|nr:hypothetical protein GCM10010207_83320 [Streptomyces atratus]
MVIRSRVNRWSEIDRTNDSNQWYVISDTNESRVVIRTVSGWGPAILPDVAGDPQAAQVFRVQPSFTMTESPFTSTCECGHVDVNGEVCPARFTGVRVRRPLLFLCRSARGRGAGAFRMCE